MKVVIAGANAAKLVICPIAPGPMPGGNLTNWVLCVLTDKRARTRAKERGVAREACRRSSPAPFAHTFDVAMRKVLTP